MRREDTANATDDNPIADDEQTLDVSALQDASEAIVTGVTTDKKYYASVFPGKRAHVPKEFAESIKALEANLGMPVWFIIQNGSDRFSSLNANVSHALFTARHTLAEGEPIALLLESPGGEARYAYKIARFLSCRCNEFTVIVPQYAKSAATLLTLGASQIILGPYAELGPLDAQIIDRDREDQISALDEVKSVELLHSAALEAVDQSILFWLRRSGKKLDTLLPTACTFVSSMMKPMFEKIDTVHFTQLSRILKEAEEYAVRLLKPRYDALTAMTIASRLVEKYPVHGFCIDADEAGDLGLEVEMPTSEQAVILDRLMPFLDTLTVIGRIEEEQT